MFPPVTFRARSVHVQAAVTVAVRSPERALGGRGGGGGHMLQVGPTGDCSARNHAYWREVPTQVEDYLPSWVRK